MLGAGLGGVVRIESVSASKVTLDKETTEGRTHHQNIRRSLVGAWPEVQCKAGDGGDAAECGGHGGADHYGVGDLAVGEELLSVAAEGVAVGDEARDAIFPGREAAALRGHLRVDAVVAVEHPVVPGVAQREGGQEGDREDEDGPADTEQHEGGSGRARCRGGGCVVEAGVGERRRRATNWGWLETVSGGLELREIGEGGRVALKDLQLPDDEICHGAPGFVGGRALVERLDGPQRPAEALVVEVVAGGELVGGVSEALGCLGPFFAVSQVLRRVLEGERLAWGLGHTAGWAWGEGRRRAATEREGEKGDVRDTRGRFHLRTIAGAARFRQSRALRRGECARR